MKTAKLIKDVSETFHGEAKLYKVWPPMKWEDRVEEKIYKTRFIVVSAAVIQSSGPETYIFPADETGEVMNWRQLNGSYQGGLDHKTALNKAGYIIKERK